MSEESNSMEIILEQLASQANLPKMVEDNPALPTNWVSLKVFSASSNPMILATQGFLAKGPNANGDIVAVLALGVTWETFLTNQTLPINPLASIPLPVDVAGSSAPESAKVMAEYSNAYGQIRSDIWSTLDKFLNELPLYICGMSLGGPIAQIAALDLRKENKGPNEENPPKPSPSSYVFSTGNFGNSAFATYYKSVVTDYNIIWAGSPSLAVDFFPTKPDNSDFVPLKTATSVNALIPKHDVPWLERSDVFYLKALGGEPDKYAPSKGSFPSTPSGFSRSLSYTLSMLVGAAYTLAQHPSSLVSISPYSLEAVIKSNGSPFAYIFTSVTDVVVAIRGTITWEEIFTYSCDSSVLTVAYGSNSQSQVHKGTYTIYNNPVNPGTSNTFADQLESVIKPLLPGKDLYLAGHGIGGSVANYAAGDYAMSAGKGITVKAVYTFGGNFFANSIFASSLSTALPDNSYQIVRLNDKIPSSISRLIYSPVGVQMVLNGQLEIEESTFHSLDGYIRLLNPKSEKS